jgi:signal transduction histidine kinase
MSDNLGTSRRTGKELAAFLRARREEIIERWTAWARTLSPAERLPHEKLVDHIPRIVDRIAEMAEAMAAGQPVRPPQQESDLHALVRLEEGFDLADVVTEYAILRECIQEVSTSVPDLIPDDVRVLNRAIDEATRATVRRFAEASHRTIKALDRISTLALGKRTLQEILDELLAILMQTSPAVDSVAILLREGDRLVVRAAAGIVGDRIIGHVVPIGEGFAGTVAKERKPRLLRSAMTDPLVKGNILRDSGIRALYGVPLEDGELIGVAHMGSRTAYEFSDEDMLLFRALANRATAVIVEAQLKERERAALAARDLVLAILGHDIRNPLAVIKMSTTALLRNSGNLPPGVVRTLGRMGSSVDRIERMISQLLDYARTTQGQGFTLERRPTDLAQLCREIIEGFEISHPSAAVELAITGDCSGVWDPDRLRRVIQNLLGNAIEHGDAEGLVQLSLEGGAGEVVLAIRNQNGDGPIPPELLPRIFEPFRTGGGEGEQHDGLGLGLYIAQQIILAHGGSVGVESTQHDGTIFTVRLPR